MIWLCVVGLIVLALVVAKLSRPQLNKKCSTETPVSVKEITNRFEKFDSEKTPIMNKIQV